MAKRMNRPQMEFQLQLLSVINRHPELDDLRALNDAYLESLKPQRILSEETKAKMREAKNRGQLEIPVPDQTAQVETPKKTKK